MPDETKSQDLNVEAWQDEFGRLCIWAGNIGAHQKGQFSLDFRLRDSSHIRQRVIKLLNEILKSLQEVAEAMAERGDEDVESLNECESGDQTPQTVIQQLRESIATTISCLFEMSMLVRKPAKRDHRMSSSKTDVAYFEPFDRNHVRDKFPAADERLVARLGQAITRRRQYFRYRERHAMKLRQGLDPGTMSQDKSESLSQTVATESRNMKIGYDDQRSESGYPMTSYASTLISDGNVTIPAPPKKSMGGKAFECPYCYFIITVDGPRSWNRHVLGDLQPYVCTELDCTTAVKVYTTRHEWLHHSRTAHPREVSSESESVDQVEGTNCVLCSAVLPNEKRLDKHLARHLQELALFVLPSTAEDVDENHEDMESDRAKASSVGTQGGDDTSSDGPKASQDKDETSLFEEEAQFDTVFKDAEGTDYLNALQSFA